MARPRKYKSLPYELRVAKRQEALKLLSMGINGAQVARHVGTTRAAVSLWKAQADKISADLSPQSTMTGRRAILSEEQVREAIACLKHPPQTYKIVHKKNSWTWDTITEFVNSRYHLTCGRSTVQRALRKAGWDIGLPT